MQELVRRHMARLEPEQREVLLLRYYAGKSVKEVAAVLEIKPDAAGKRLQRAREALGERLVTALGESREGEERTRERVARVMGAVAVAGVAWQASATAGSGFAALLSARVAAGLLLVAGIAAGMWTLTGQQEEGASMPTNQVFLDKAVAAIEDMVANKEHGARGHAGHWLFALRVAGHDVDYDTLMCLTGLAFSFYYCHNDFHVAYHVPPAWEERVARAIGAQWETLPRKDADEAWQYVKASIDSGRVMWGEYMEGVTFAGYADPGEKEERSVFAIDPVFVWPGKWWTWKEFAEWWNNWAEPFPWAMQRYDKRVEPVSAKASGLEILRMIPTWAQDDHPEGMPEARFGLAGIEEYAKDIADTSKDEEFMIGPWRGCHAIDWQWKARKCPGPYLRSLVSVFDGEAKGHILKAAEQYDAAFAAWEEWNEQLGANAPKDSWASQERRAAGAAAVLKALAHEKAAVRQVEAALVELAGQSD